jgi:hypothetical protein
MAHHYFKFTNHTLDSFPQIKNRLSGIQEVEAEVFESLTEDPYTRKSCMGFYFPPF